MKDIRKNLSLHPQIVDMGKKIQEHRVLDDFSAMVSTLIREEYNRLNLSDTVQLTKKELEMLEEMRRRARSGPKGPHT